MPPDLRIRHSRQNNMANVTFGRKSPIWAALRCQMQRTVAETARNHNSNTCTMSNYAITESISWDGEDEPGMAVFRGNDIAIKEA